MRKMAALFITLVLAAPSTARIITVDDDSPADFNNIQAAIDDATDGDTVEVQPGTYTGAGNRNLQFGGRAITMVSAEGPYATIIDCQGSARGFLFNGNEGPDSIVDGFTITRGYSLHPWGGGMCVDHASPTITNCIISANHADHGAGIYFIDSGSEVSNCLFQGNASTFNGGAIYNRGSSTKILNCTFVGNQAASECVMQNFLSPHVTMVNSVVWSNTGSSSDFIGVKDSTLILAHCNIQGGLGQIATSLGGEVVDNGGNIDADPIFVNTSTGGYHLSARSPCKDSGDNSAVPPSLSKDLDGNPRIVNGTVDMGAFEAGEVGPPQVYYVDGLLGSDDNDGLSPTTAFLTIQKGIDTAEDGDTVIIEPGTYTGPGNYNIRFNGKAITVRGTAPEDFDIVAATVIDCNGQGLGFIFDRGEDPNSVLSGVTVTNAYNPSSIDYGAAIGCDDSSPVITNCIITGNTGRGGGIGALHGSLTVKNCIIANNHSRYSGGGIYSAGQVSLTVDNCLVIRNTAAHDGGGIRTTAYTGGTIKDCLIVGNRAGDYGGAISCKRGPTLIQNCTITGNVARDLGGALRAYGGSCTAIILNSIIYGNHAPLGAQIGVDDVWWDSSISLSWCDIQGGQDDLSIEPDCTLAWGPGNIDADPCFADPGYWGHIADPNIHVEPNDPNASWVDGDYHLKSQAGRWNANEGGWTIDEVTSLCIDAGDPNYPIGPEPFPNGGRMNIGVYGGTAEASKSYFDKPPCETIVAGDINGDCIIDGGDFALLARNWLISDLEPPNPWVPGRATNPDPCDGTIDPYIGRSGLTLSWQAGTRAETHDVYFGTVSPGDFQGNQSETEFHPDIVFASGTYYWRIDEINAHGKTTGAVWSFSISPPGAATDPYPADGATGVCAGRGDIFSLSWTGGDRAETHDIYFGTVSPGEFQASQTTFDTDFSLGPALLTGTYFWRIDEVSGDVKTTGPVWTFSVEGPPAPTNPYPADGAEHTSVPLILSWQPGEGAETHGVYFGTESPGDFQANQIGTTFDPGALESERTYYWRIDEISDCGKTIGPVWTFETSPPDPATDPYPADQSDYSSTAVTLTWQPGAGAESHDIYFGTESPGEFQANQAEAAFDPGLLEAQRTYYWRIDEVNSYGKTTGMVWQFTCLPGR